MAVAGAIFPFRHQFIPSFIKNLASSNTLITPTTWASNRTFSQTTKLEGSPPFLAKKSRFVKLTDLCTVGPVHNVQWSSVPRMSGSGNTPFSTISSRDRSGLSSLFDADSWRSNMCKRMFFSGSSQNSGNINLAKGKGKVKGDETPSPVNNPAWHGVRLSNENGYLSYNRNAYLCLVIGATMNVQTIIPHSAEAAVAFFFLGALNVLYGTVGFTVNLVQLRPQFGLSRLAYWMNVSWAMIHIVLYFLIASLYLKTLEEGETLEDVGRTIQSRNLLDLDDDDGEDQTDNSKIQKP
ncbi:uncharacterized protein LOC135484184 isoform X1 [Lineus longissimus]|uniref:uncharacterized protein LOC135484184 isoform X1 n=1 Tax=Lineus longissimus TaxID=88925 RepID=UPI002B4CAEA8